MPHRSTLKYSLTAAVAASALAASTAVAKPLDRIDRFGTPAPEAQPDPPRGLVYPKGPFYPEPDAAVPHPRAVPAAPVTARGGDDDGIWLVLGIGLAGAGLAAGGAGLARHARVRARRVAV